MFSDYEDMYRVKNEENYQVFDIENLSQQSFMSDKEKFFFQIHNIYRNIDD